MKIPNGVEAYAIIMSQYVQEYVNNVEKYLYERGLVLFKKVSTPLLKKYSPEVDGIPELYEREASYHQSLIGILRWMVEMGRLDICMEVSAMSSFVTMPREGNFQKLLHLFAYLKIHHNAHKVFDPSYPEIYEEDIKKHDWSDIYGYEPETVPYNAPMPLGSEFMMRDYVDA